MKNVIGCLAIAFVIVLAGCTPGVPEGLMIASGPILQSNHSRVEAAEITGDDRDTLIRDNTDFAFNLYRQLNDASNVFFSPYSISTALAMTSAGAAGTTKEKMAQAMQLELSAETLHPAFNWLERELASRSEGKNAEDFRLQVVNAIWGQKNYKYKTVFLDTLAENYGAGLRIQNFINNPDASRILINDWIGEQSGGKIKELLSPNSITTNTRLVLTNAIYFKAAWKDKFMQRDTTNLSFYLPDGSAESIPMMKQVKVLGHGKGDDYQSVELPYQGNNVSMLVLLPDEGKLAGFEDSLNYRKLTNIIAGLEKANINLTMPKFQFESGFKLKEALSALGMSEAFSADKADFSSMTDSDKLWLDEVTHKACVSVDENGTEASAATVATMVASLPVTITIDRPFIFLIRDVETGAILFMGRVLNPDT